MTTEVIIITLVNLFWGFVWFEVGRWIGRKENEKNDYRRIRWLRHSKYAERGGI